MKMKYTIPGQIFSVILTHLEAAFIFFFVWMIAISITSTKIGGIIYSAISTVFYFIMIYASSYNIEKSDQKSYTELTPYPHKGLLLSSGLLVLNIIALIIYKLAWMLGGNGEILESVWAIIGNVFGLFWFSPYMCIAGIEKGNIAVLGYALIFLLHTAACFLGYLAGYKKFDITTKFRFLMYEKKK